MIFMEYFALSVVSNILRMIPETLHAILSDHSNSFTTEAKLLAVLTLSFDVQPPMVEVITENPPKASKGKRENVGSKQTINSFLVLFRYTLVLYYL